MENAYRVHVVAAEARVMTFSEHTVTQIRRAMGNTPGLSERPLYSGVTFMVQGNMCCGMIDDHLVVRVGPDTYDAALREPHTRPMDFTGRPLPGFVYVDRAGFADTALLRQWIDRGVSFVRTLPPKS
jgi:TfoX N-terminal domain